MQNKPLSFSVDIRLNQRRNLLNFDYSIVLTVFLLGLFGLAMIYKWILYFGFKASNVLFLGVILMITAAMSNFRKMEPIYLNAV